MSGGPDQPAPHEPTDAELVRRAAAGDRAAFETLYRRHRDWVLALAWRFTRHRSDALDVAQETFAYLWRRIPTLTLEARLTTFLYPAVRSLSLDAIKRRARHAPSTGADPGDTRASVTDTIRETANGLREAVAGLSDDHAEVVLMRFVHDMTIPEIAAALAIPLGTAKTRLHHALNRLRADPRARACFDEEKPESA